MLSQQRYQRVVDEAYKQVSNFIQHNQSSSALPEWPGEGSDWEARELICGENDVGRRFRIAQDFADIQASAPVLPFRSLPEPGFSSWLIGLPEPRIAVDKSQLLDWEESTRIPWQILGARTIYHEVGHCVLNSRLLQTKNSGARGFVKTADPEEENEAWLFSILVLAFAVGDYSEFCKNEFNVDDTPGLLF